MIAQWLITLLAFASAAPGQTQACVADHRTVGPAPDALDASSVSEANGEQGSAQDSPPLTVTGLTPENTLGAADLCFTVAGAPLFSVRQSRFLVSRPTGKTLDLSDVFIYDANGNLFRASAAALDSRLASLPPGDLELTVSLVSVDFEFAAVYSLLLRRPGK